MFSRKLHFLLVVATVAWYGTTAATVPGAERAGQLPETWQAAWHDPPLSIRPMQIVHGHLFHRGGQLQSAASIRTSIEGLRGQGLGGIVCNVPFETYMQNEEDWTALRSGVEVCRDLGMAVWLYDEDGYPSGAAGGLVLQQNPSYEALELAFDTSQDDPFLLRPSYEFTHANNNYYASRRYANLIDAEATDCFVHTTHEAYWKRLGPLFGSPIEAFFTDEPSLLAVSLGQIPEEARQRVRVVDPPDADIKPLPAVPWCRDLAEQYRKRYGQDLLPQRVSLFTGSSAADQAVRRQYWALIADLMTERFFGKLGRWCDQHRVASSGHSLHEESILHHVPLEGNGLKGLSQMQIPGMDMLSSDPRAVTYSGWLTAAMPCSAAALMGRRRCMTEVSDFQQKMGGSGPASVRAMQATAAWQAAWGVTDFTLYYNTADRSSADTQAYCDFVGRVNALLKPADKDASVLLYYPIYDLWSEYRPVAEKLALASQSDRAKAIVLSFNRIGQALQRSQVPFVLVDHEFLADAEVTNQGQLRLAGHLYRTIVLPADVDLPPAAAAVVKRLRDSQGTVWQDKRESPLHVPQTVQETVAPRWQLDPPSPDVALGAYHRDKHQVLLLVNVGPDAYRGSLVCRKAGDWTRADPATGTLSLQACDAQGRLMLELAPSQTVLLVRP